MNKRNVYTLIIVMFFISAAYTMLIPFLPLYLMELGVTGKDVNFWTGMVFSICFLVAGIMGPVWGKLADTKGKRKWCFGPLSLSVFLTLWRVLCRMNGSCLA